MDDKELEQYREDANRINEKKGILLQELPTKEELERSRNEPSLENMLYKHIEREQKKINIKLNILMVLVIPSVIICAVIFFEYIQSQIRSGSSGPGVIHEYNGDSNVYVDKPVVYVYNDTDDAEVTVRVTDKSDGKIDTEYPASDDGAWNIEADAEGHVTYQGRNYNYLYWEDTVKSADVDFDKGFCVKGSETVSFLEDACEKLGLTDTETADFVTYWLPRMKDNAYNLIQFNPAFYKEDYELSSDDRTVDNIITAYMVYKPVENAVDIDAQDLSELNDTSRSGLTFVEWGGTELK